ncbi:hypothetical protein B9057_07605 [Aestuarium zhoushanense]|nr:hypothetical protein B9057_07605 [Aestuarium zhoushanense]
MRAVEGFLNFGVWLIHPKIMRSSLMQLQVPSVKVVNIRSVQAVTTNGRIEPERPCRSQSYGRALDDDLM